MGTVPENKTKKQKKMWKYISIIFFSVVSESLGSIWGLEQYTLIFKVVGRCRPSPTANKDYIIEYFYKNIYNILLLPGPENNNVWAGITAKKNPH